MGGGAGQYNTEKAAGASWGEAGDDGEKGHCPGMGKGGLDTFRR